MRELLGELKDGGEAVAGRPEFVEGNGVGSVAAEGSRLLLDPPFLVSSHSDLGQDNLQLSSHHDVAMDLINSVTGVDEEGHFRQRVLSFAAKRYVSAIERNPEDPDAYYNWALVLQESADNVDPDSNSSKDSLFEEACKMYAEATWLCSTLYDAYYNWAIAIADRVKMCGCTKEAEELWKQVADTWESPDGWLDAIRLVNTIFASGKSVVLAGIITGCLVCVTG